MPRASDQSRAGGAVAAAWECDVNDLRKLMGTYELSVSDSTYKLIAVNIGMVTKVALGTYAAVTVARWMGVTL